MLVCPECQFENPNGNRFCQKCGTSLTEKQCPACGAIVLRRAETCSSCGEPTGTVWRAVLYPSSASVLTTVSSDETEEAGAKPWSLSGSLSSEFLDENERYQLLEKIDEAAIAPNGLDALVLDCLPLSPSRLDELCREQTLSPDCDPEVLAAQCGMPAIALDYLQLEHQLYPSIPSLQDAWRTDTVDVVLLEDRQLLPSLQEFWQQDGIAPFQMVHLFHQMAELWRELHTYHYATSLLEPTNLRIDEDQLLYLLRLYPDPPDQEPDLTHLGGFWKALLSSNSDDDSNVAALKTLCEDLQSKTILLVDELGSRLEAIANDLQDSELPMQSLMGVQNDDDITDPTLPLEHPATTLPPATVPSDCESAAVSIEIPESDNDDVGDEGDDIPTIVLPMSLFSLEDAGRSDVGRQRDHNEDYFRIHTQSQKTESIAGRNLQVKGLYILCDGMGGHASGEIASAMAADTLHDYFMAEWKDELPSEDIIRQGILEANRVLFEKNQENESSGSGRMGTTVVVMLVHGTKVAIAHVGDSRLYRFSRRQGIEQVTTDHEVGQREIHRGVEPSIAYARPDAYQLTQALGPRDGAFVSPDIQFLDLNEDTLLLLCSDGLTDNDLIEKYCDTHVEPLLSSQANLEQGVVSLIDLANQHNGHDNITSIVVRFKLRPNVSATPCL